MNIVEVKALMAGKSMMVLVDLSLHAVRSWSFTAFIMRSITISAFIALPLVSSAEIKALMAAKSMIKVLVYQLLPLDGGVWACRSPLFGWFFVNNDAIVFERAFAAPCSIVLATYCYSLRYLGEWIIVFHVPDLWIKINIEIYFQVIQLIIFNFKYTTCILY